MIISREKPLLFAKIYGSCKGQLISKRSFGIIVSNKKPTNFFKDFALASKNMSIQKNKGTLYHQLEDFILTLLTLFF